MQIVDNATVRLNASFTEPTKSVDASPLSDLHHTTIYGQVGTNPASSLVTTPASALGGGGLINTTVLVPAPAGVLTKMDLWVTATDITGNESPPSTHVTVNIDRIGPAAPTNFTVA